MFGIGLPEMIVILAVALIVIGPEKLPDMARSLAKGVFELKKTLNQVKTSLAEEENLLGSVQSDLRKTAADLQSNLSENPHYESPGSGSGAHEGAVQDGDIIDVESEVISEVSPAAEAVAIPQDAAEQGEGAGQGQELEGQPAENQPAIPKQ